MPAGTNPFAIGEQLSGMSDQQLMQLAQMHSDDAIMMSALMSEKQRRQHMQGAAQAQGPQATVRDQIMQSMAPADTGVAQLPVENQGYADGGVVGFADGGLSNWAGGQFPPSGYSVDPEAEERAMAGGATLGLPRYPGFFQYGPAPSSKRRVESGKAQPGFVDRLRESGNPFGPLGEWLGEKAYGLGQYMGTEVTEREARERALRGEARPKKPEYLPPEEVAREDAKLARIPAPPVRVTAVQSGEAGRAGASASVSSRTPGNAGLAAVASPEFASAEDYLGPARQHKQDIEARVNAERELRKQGQPGGEAYSGLEAALRKDEEAEPGRRNEAKGLAILTAGLAVMGGTSPYALANFKEATAGITQYRDSIKDIERAAKERMRAKADIEQARRAEAMGNWRDQQGFEERATGRIERADELYIKAVGDVTKTMDERTKDIFITKLNNAQRKYDTDSQAATSRATAGIYASARGAGAGGGPDVKVLIAQHNQLSGRIKKIQGDLTGGKLFNPKDKAAAQEELAVLKGQLQSVTEMMRAHGGANIEETPAVPGGAGWNISPIK